MIVAFRELTLSTPGSRLKRFPHLVILGLAILLSTRKIAANTQVCGHSVSSQEPRQYHPPPSFVCPSFCSPAHPEFSGSEK